MVEKDIKRTNLKAFRIDAWPENEIAELGACYKMSNDYFAFSCPGCGRFAGVRVGHPKPQDSPSWDVVSGNVEDPTTVTLAPSINCKGCCGWHGYLQNGMFVSC